MEEEFIDGIHLRSEDEGAKSSNHGSISFEFMRRTKGHKTENGVISWEYADGK
jgi:hypothetical protein